MFANFCVLNITNNINRGSPPCTLTHNKNAFPKCIYTYTRVLHLTQYAGHSPCWSYHKVLWPITVIITRVMRSRLSAVSLRTRLFSPFPSASYFAPLTLLCFSPSLFLFIPFHSFLTSCSLSLNLFSSLLSFSLSFHFPLPFSLIFSLSLPSSQFLPPPYSYLPLLPLPLLGLDTWPIWKLNPSSPFSPPLLLLPSPLPSKSFLVSAMQKNSCKLLHKVITLVSPPLSSPLTSPLPLVLSPPSPLLAPSLSLPPFHFKHFL